MAVREFQVQAQMLKRVAKVVNAFESEQVQLRVLDSLLAALAAPEILDAELAMVGQPAVSAGEPMAGIAQPGA
jgi:hypothetical protein